ncbi:MAG: hypothetical protein GY926_00790 [bacterium]|nr:hypothetical protein [bacterium]
MTTATATAPASSANLGPGFDCLGLALELRCRVAASVSDSWVVEELGNSFEPAPHDYVRRAVKAAVGRPMRVVINNDVPRSRGLGSSSAVMVAAAAAAMRALGTEPESSQLFEMVTAIEGHGDNAGAAVYGGLVAVSGGVLRRLDLDPELKFVFGIPDDPLKTEMARSALPDDIPRQAATRNVARVAFLLDGLRTGDATSLANAAGDEIHEVYRADLSPATGEMMMAARDAGALHAAWSGAGPTAIAVTTQTEPVVAAMKSVLNGAGSVEVLDVARTGWS